MQYEQSSSPSYSRAPSGMLICSMGEERARAPLTHLSIFLVGDTIYRHGDPDIVQASYDAFHNKLRQAPDKGNLKLARQAATMFSGFLGPSHEEFTEIMEMGRCAMLADVFFRNERNIA